MVKIGHRGASGYESENTLASFEKALELKVDGIELDVHLSLDKELMVIHDETIDRTTNGKGFVNKLTALELKKYGIPTLKEVFDLIDKKCIVNIEIKDVKSPKFVNDFIKKNIKENHWNYNQIIVSSFEWDTLLELSTLNKKIKLGVLTEEIFDGAISFAKMVKAFSINPNFNSLTTESIKNIHKEGFQIHTWTVNTQEDITFVKSLGVDAIISDFPDRI